MNLASLVANSLLSVAVATNECRLCGSLLIVSFRMFSYNLPTLSKVRSIYRYLYRLLEVQGSVEIEKWMRHPPLFDEFAAN